MLGKVMASFRVTVSVDVLIWARRNNGLTTEDAARKIKVSEIELRMWEEGVEDPPIDKLREAARVYKYPLAVLLLPKPPVKIEVLRDFRLLSENNGSEFSPALQRQFRRVQYQQHVARELASADGGAPPSIDLDVSLDEAPEEAARKIREWLTSHSPFGGANGRRPDLREWISLVERKGVLVAQVGGVKLEEMRGCSFGARPFPVIVLNGKDSRTGKLFTLFHELVHVLLGEETICDLAVRNVKSSTLIERTERFCDQVSAAVLMPADDLMADPTVLRAHSRSEWTINNLQQLAAPFHMSPEVLLRRLATLGKTSMEFYWQMRPYFIRTYLELREREEMDQKDSGGGPSSYVLKIRNFGRRFIGDVLDAYDRDLIDPSDVSDYLDIKVNNIPKLVKQMAL